MQEQIKFHIGLHVSDINKTVEFYQHLFNQAPVKQKVDYAKFELDNPGLVISFMQAPAHVSNQFGHLGLRVANQEQLAARKEEVEKFLDIALEEKNTNCCYAQQDKFWVNDPDGYEWEVYHFKKDVEKQDKQFEASPCC
ncbi:MAG: ArsI/CadI family heavy metal resistance metalloenzyme [Marinoscillum sp.]